MSFNYKYRIIGARAICVCLLVVLGGVVAIASPSKVQSKTAAAKAPPAGAVGAEAARKKLTSSKSKVAKAVNAKAPVKAAAKAAPAKNVKPIAKKESVVDKFAPQLKPVEKKQQKKKPIKMRKQVVDGKVCMWGRSAEDAEMSATESVRKFVGNKGEFQLKDSVIAVDGAKYYCLLRFNYTDKIPETWYLETEMVTGFGKNKLRAFADAVSRARARVKRNHSMADWMASNSSMKDSTEMGFIPYDFVFATAGKTVYCKIFFRYLKPR